jgi:phage-related protein
MPWRGSDKPPAEPVVMTFHAKSIIRVYGNGAGNVYIGDQVIQILQNDGYIDLNGETHNAYDASGFCNGYVKSEDFPDLKPGRITSPGAGLSTI